MFKSRLLFTQFELLLIPSSSFPVGRLVPKAQNVRVSKPGKGDAVVHG